MRKDGQKISIVTAPISIPRESIFETAIRDHTLSNYICQFRKDLERQGVEVFARKENILATEHGYYSAMYEDDIRNMEGGIDNPVPFKGKDGRLKVQVTRENGELAIADLAELVAMAYCPNTAKFKHTFFRDGNPENCNADNIFWLSKFEYFILKTKYNIKQWILKIYHSAKK